MSKYWQEYVRAAYDLVLESEGRCKIFLDNSVEAYIVHLFAKNINRTDIGQQAIAIQMLEQMQKPKNHANYQPIADECLLIDSFPLKRQKWPSDNYYKEMGCIAYGLANLVEMENNFVSASRVLNHMFLGIYTKKA
jgi:hypothetical protein